MSNNIFKIALVAFGLFLTGCAAMGPKSPDFYPNDKFSRVGPGQASADARNCMALADEYVQEPSKWQDALVRGGMGAGAGAAAGAVGGVIMQGKVGRATAAGAAIGGILGVLNSLSEVNERSPSYQRFVEHCLQKKGYEVVGWSAKSGGY